MAILNYIKIKNGKLRWTQIEQKKGMTFMRMKQRQWYAVDVGR